MLLCKFTLKDATTLSFNTENFRFLKARGANGPKEVNGVLTIWLDTPETGDKLLTLSDIEKIEFFREEKLVFSTSTVTHPYEVNSYYHPSREEMIYEVYINEGE